MVEILHPRKLKAIVHSFDGSIDPAWCRICCITSSRAVLLMSTSWILWYVQSLVCPIIVGYCWYFLVIVGR